MSETATIAGVPPAIAARLPGFVEDGIALPLLIDTVRRAESPANPAWPEIVAAVGERDWARAEAAERAGDDATAARAYLDASFWFFFARFPHILNEGGARAFRRHNEAYARAARYFRDPMERVAVPFGGGEFPALLRLPRDRSGAVPLVLISGGIDVWKSDFEIHFQSEQLLRRGVATLAIDIAGTGEAPIPADAEGDRLHRAALDWVRRDPRLDGARLGVYGLSFGGHYAARLALRDPSLKGVVLVGAPLHFTFSDENVARLPPHTLAALGRIAGIDPRHDPAALAAALRAFSLARGGLLPARAHAPLLSINGALDELVPIRDLSWLGEQGVRQDTLVFGGDRHCASGNRRLHAPLTAEWLAAKLAA